MPAAEDPPMNPAHILTTTPPLSRNCGMRTSAVPALARVARAVAPPARRAFAALLAATIAVTTLLDAGGAAAQGLFRGRTSAAAQALAPATVTHGPFTIVLEPRTISSGTFPNQGRYSTVTISTFSILYNGKPVVVQHGSRQLSRFFRVSILTDAPRPALLASSMDFHLVTERDGKPLVQSVGSPTTETADFQWLDGPGGQPTPMETFGNERVRTDELPLAGGRYLLLRGTAVLDVKTLALHPSTITVEKGPLRGVGGPVAFAFSPGATQFVT